VSTCRHPLATRPILYSDTIDGKQVGRDDMWAVTTEELNALRSASEATIRLDECRRIMHALDKYPHASDYGPPIKERMVELANPTDSGNHQ